MGMIRNIARLVFLATAAFEFLQAFQLYTQGPAYLREANPFLSPGDVTPAYTRIMIYFVLSLGVARLSWAISSSRAVHSLVLEIHLIEAIFFGQEMITSGALERGVQLMTPNQILVLAFVLLVHPLLLIAGQPGAPKQHEA